MTFDEWNKKHGAFDYLDTSDEVRAAEAGWNAALKHSENAAAQVPETVRTGETDLGLSTPAAAALLEEAYALLRAAAVGTNILGDAGEWCLRAAAAPKGDEIAKAAQPFRDAFDYDPGHSDLDDEQPINITVTLGDWRRLDFALAILDAEPRDP